MRSSTHPDSPGISVSSGSISRSPARSVTDGISSSTESLPVRLLPSNAFAPTRPGLSAAGGLRSESLIDRDVSQIHVSGVLRGYAFALDGADVNLDPGLMRALMAREQRLLVAPVSRGPRVAYLEAP